ncbi:MAG: hypothetical protein M3N39_00295, partial [Pseudomonadota bacterium]|nr:hypothetical protein [Pseudomonadota bacterium]
MDWHGVKLLLVEATGVSRDALHVLGGVGGQFFLVLLLRRPLASPLPWGLMFGAALVNELYDFTYDVGFYLPLWPEALHDLWLTMALPTALFCIARWAPRLLVADAPTRRWSSPAGPREGSSGALARYAMAALARLN